MLSREQIQVCTLLVLASMNHVGFPGRSIDKESACNAGDSGSIPGLKSPLEKEMATHSSILPWKILWTEESDGLQPVETQSDLT